MHDFVNALITLDLMLWCMFGCAVIAYRKDEVSLEFWLNHWLTASLVPTILLGFDFTNRDLPPWFWPLAAMPWGFILQHMIRGIWRPTHVYLSLRYPATGGATMTIHHRRDHATARRNNSDDPIVTKMRID